MEVRVKGNSTVVVDNFEAKAKYMLLMGSTLYQLLISKVLRLVMEVTG